MVATIKYAELAVVVMAVVLFAALALFARHTRAGMAWRATVSEPAMASSFGVDLRRVRYLNFFIGSAFAAVAGVMVATLNNVVEPQMGAVPSYKALAIIVIGGFGNLQGTLVAALLLGIVESYGVVFLSAWLDRDSVAFAVMLVVLMLRPQGIFAAGGRGRRGRIARFFKTAKEAAS
jgi:branched-chain amino acid transport system permease protein